MSKRYRVKPAAIKSLDDLRLQKARIRLEIMKQEENIQSDYRRIRDALTFRNIAANLVEDISVQSAIVSRVFSFGKALFAKRKKKKKE